MKHHIDNKPTPFVEGIYVMFGKHYTYDGIEYIYNGEDMIADDWSDVFGAMTTLTSPAPTTVRESASTLGC